MPSVNELEGARAIDTEVSETEEPTENLEAVAQDEDAPTERRDPKEVFQEEMANSLTGKGANVVVKLKDDYYLQLQNDVTGGLHA